MLGRTLSILILLVATVAWSAQAVSDEYDQLNSFTEEGDLNGFHTYWNTKPDGAGGWKYIAGWMDSNGTVVEEQEFFSDGAIDSSKGGTPVGGPKGFHDWASSHGFSINSGTWGDLGRPCGLLEVCPDWDIF
jgi:hypothetical protein